MVYILIALFLCLVFLSVSTNLAANKIAQKHGVTLKRKFLFYTDMQDIVDKIENTTNDELRKSLSRIVKMKFGIKVIQVVAVIIFVYYIYSGSWQA